MHVAGLSADPGQKVSGTVSVKIGDTTVGLPVFLVNGLGNGPSLTVTAGIHGGEYPCVEAASRLGRTLEPASISGQVLIVPSANPPAFAARSIYVNREDGKNLNRQFPGDAGGTFTQAWAAWLFEHVISGSNMYIDLHGGDMIEALVPFVAFDVVGDPEVDEPARQMAEAFGIGYALARETSGGPTGTTTGSGARAGIPSLLAEAGGQGVWDEENVDILRSGVLRVMSAMGMLPEPLANAMITAPAERVKWLRGWSWLRAEVDGLFYPKVAVGVQVSKGQDVGHVADIFGNTLQEITAPESGIILFLVTSLSMNAGDPLMAVAF